MNARKEGLFSCELLIAEADRPLYDKVCADLRRQLRRDTIAKQIAVENIITCTWRCVLALRVEGRRIKFVLADEADAVAENESLDPNSVRWFGSSRMELKNAIRVLLQVESVMRTTGNLTDEYKQMLSKFFGSNFVEFLAVWPDVKTQQMTLLSDYLKKRNKDFGWEDDGLPEPYVALDPARAQTIGLTFIAERKDLLEGLLKLQEQAWVTARLSSNADFNPRFYASAVKDLQRAFDWYSELCEKGL